MEDKYSSLPKETKQQPEVKSLYESVCLLSHKTHTHILGSVIMQEDFFANDS